MTHPTFKFNILRSLASFFKFFNFFYSFSILFPIKSNSILDSVLKLNPCSKGFGTAYSLLKIWGQSFLVKFGRKLQRGYIVSVQLYLWFIVFCMALNTNKNTFSKINIKQQTQNNWKTHIKGAKWVISKVFSLRGTIKQ